MDPLDELLHDAGVAERETTPLARRDTHAVVTDPNTELLKQVLARLDRVDQQLRSLSMRLDYMRYETSAPTTRVPAPNLTPWEREIVDKIAGKNLTKINLRGITSA